MYNVLLTMKDAYANEGELEHVGSVCLSCVCVCVDPDSPCWSESAACGNEDLIVVLCSMTPLFCLLIKVSTNITLLCLQKQLNQPDNQFITSLVFLFVSL